MNFPPIQINFEQKRSLGEQIAAQLTEHIIHQRLKPGDQLPPVRELALQLRVNFNTVARAYRVLDAGGWISTQQGRGTYVRANKTLQDSKEEAKAAMQIEAIKELILLEADRSGKTLRQMISQIEAELIPDDANEMAANPTGSLQASSQTHQRKPGKISRKSRWSAQKNLIFSTKIPKHTRKKGTRS